MAFYSVVLVFVPDPEDDRPAAKQFKYIMQARRGKIFEYEFHLLHASREAVVGMPWLNTYAVLGYVIQALKPGAPVVIGRDAVVLSCDITEGRCRFKLQLNHRATFRPLTTNVPAGGKRVFTMIDPTRYPQYPDGVIARRLRRLGIQLFSLTGWVWFLRATEIKD